MKLWQKFSVVFDRTNATLALNPSASTASFSISSVSESTKSVSTLSEIDIDIGPVRDIPVSELALTETLLIQN
jgi:hypothetical protein